MKTIRSFVILMLLFLLAWNVFGHSSNLTLDFDGERFDGPVGAMAGVLFAGAGMIVAALVMLFVGFVLAVLFAGLGVVLALGLGLAALVVAAAVSPLLLPFLIPVAIVWFFVGRARRNRLASQAI